MGTDESELTVLSLNSTAVLWGVLPKLIASLTLQQDVLGSNSHTKALTCMYNLWIKVVCTQTVWNIARTSPNLPYLLQMFSEYSAKLHTSYSIWHLFGRMLFSTMYVILILPLDSLPFNSDIGCRHGELWPVIYTHVCWQHMPLKFS